jgi:hypothetical protein
MEQRRQRAIDATFESARVYQGLNVFEPPREMAYVWRNPGEDKREEVERLTAEGKKVVQISWSESEVVERDGRRIPVPRYGGDGRDESDCLEGEVVSSAPMIEHAVAVEHEPQLAASSPLEALSVVPEPESPAVRYETRADRRLDQELRRRLSARLLFRLS